MNIEGRIHCFGDHIDTDVIIPSKFLTKATPEHLATGCFAHMYPEFRGRVQEGDILFAGENFGCGSSREHAPIAIKGTGIGCVVAASFSRIFFRNAINVGLPVVVSPEAIPFAREGEMAEVDLTNRVLRVGGKQFSLPQYPEQVMAIIRAGGLVPYMTQRQRSIQQDNA